MALSGVGGHSLHGLEDQWCPRPPSDAREIWAAERWGLAEAHEKIKKQLELRQIQLDSKL